jgi:prevent-host-death family protein
MLKTNIADVKARLSEYLERAERGERILICRRNKPVAELRAIEQVRTDPRPVGPLPGRPLFQIPPSFFDAMPADELDLWEKSGSTDPLSQGPAPATRRESRAAEPKPPYGARGRSRRRQ